MAPDADDPGSQEEALLTLLLAEAPIGFAFLDRDLRFRRVNAALARLNGHSVEAHLGCTVAEALGPKHAAALEPLLRRALGGTPVLNAEVSAEEPDGARHFLVSYYPVKSAGGIAGVGVIMEDVTERRRAEDARLGSERRFRAMFEHGSEAVCLTDAGGTVCYATPAIRRVLGYAPEEFVGVSAFDIIHPEDREAIMHQASKFVGEPGAVQTFLHRLRHKDGSWRLVEATSTNLLDDPAVGGLVANFRDITERERAEERVREAEARLVLFLESVTDYAILTMDTRGRIVSWNVGAERAFGYPEAEAVGRMVGIIFTPEDRECGAPEQEMRQARETGRAEDERWHVRRDGSRFYVSGILTPLRDGGGRLIGYAKIARDMSEQRRAEEQRSRAHDEMEARVRFRTRELAEANEVLWWEALERQKSEKTRAELRRRLASAQEDERRRIARDLHDGLGQHVAALSLGLKSLEEALPPGAPGAERLADLQGIADALGREAHDLALRLRPTALDDLGLRATLQNDAAKWADQFGVPLDFHAGGMDGERLPALLETTLYRVAQEALTNIARHAAPRHASLILDRRVDHVLLIVEDDGRGFDQKAVGGGGPERRLGLLGMRERVALVGGTLTIETAPGDGTTVFVRIPLEKP